jgi:hypothetical protein
MNHVFLRNLSLKVSRELMHKNTWLNSKFGRGVVCIGAYRVQFKFWEWRVYSLVNYQLYFYSSLSHRVLWKHIFKWVTENVDVTHHRHV